MAEHIIQTENPNDGVIIRLRCDTYDNWANSDKILKLGEAAIAVFPNESPARPPRAIGIKIGNGRHYFDELPWIQALAADVYGWAKESTKPIYTATEISGLAEYIAEHTSGGSGGGSGGSSGAYQIRYDSNQSKYILQEWNADLGQWVDTASEIDLSGILGRLNTIERWANGEDTQLGNIDLPLSEYVYEETSKQLNKLDYNDTPQSHQFVTAVDQNNGKIQVSRDYVSASDIQGGVLPTEYGGIGLTRVEDDEVLIGSINGTVTTKKFITEMDGTRNAFATAGAIKDYVDEQTAGLTGAMHFIGETAVTIAQTNSHVDPLIPGYNFRRARAGDVILANGTQEFVWDGSSWHLLGDEGSYAVKGSITNPDIADEANIAQSKIAGLSDALAGKVDKVEGKQLSTNDYTNEYKQKLDNIEDNAQVNVIEHFFLNDEEIPPTTVSGTPKSIDMHFNGMSQEQSDKLDGIEAGAQVNPTIQVNGTTVPPANNVVNLQIREFTEEAASKLENLDSAAVKKIVYDGVDYTPSENTITINSNPHTDHINRIEHIFVNGSELEVKTISQLPKSVEVAIDASALNFDVIDGAVVPKGNTTEAVEVNDKKLVLARIAKTGDVMDLLQSYNTYITLNCGSSTDVMD